MGLLSTTNLKLAHSGGLAFRVMGRGLGVWNNGIRNPLLRQEIMAYTGILGVEALEWGVHFGTYQGSDLAFNGLTNYLTLRLGQSLLAPLGGAQLMAQNRAWAQRLQGPPPNFHFHPHLSLPTIRFSEHLLAASVGISKNLKTFPSTWLQFAFSQGTSDGTGSRVVDRLRRLSPLKIKGIHDFSDVRQALVLRLRNGEDVHLQIERVEARIPIKSFLLRFLIGPQRISKEHELYVLVTNSQGEAQTLFNSSKGSTRIQEVSLEAVESHHILPDPASLTYLLSKETPNRGATLGRIRLGRKGHPVDSTPDPQSSHVGLRAAREHFAQAGRHLKAAKRIGTRELDAVVPIANKPKSNFSLRGRDSSTVMRHPSGEIVALPVNRGGPASWEKPIAVKNLFNLVGRIKGITDETQGYSRDLWVFDYTSTSEPLTLEILQTVAKPSLKDLISGKKIVILDRTLLVEQEPSLVRQITISKDREGVLHFLEERFDATSLNYLLISKRFVTKLNPSKFVIVQDK